MRKAPFVQVLGSHSIAVSWETTCQMDDGMEFGWRAAPLQAGEDGLGRKTVTLKSGESRQVAVHAEHVLGRGEMDYVKVGPRHHLYRVQLNKLPAEHLLEYSVRISPKHRPVDGAFPVLPDLTGPVPPPSPPAINPIEIAIVGDNQAGSGTFAKICRRIEARSPHLLVHLGDRVQHAWEQKDWQTQFFDPIGWHSALSSKCPILVTHGNHDVWAKGAKRDEYFLLGESGAVKDDDQTDESRSSYHALSLGPIRFVVLDANIETDAQALWLERELALPATQKSPYKIVLCHIPPFIEYWNPKTWKTGESSWPVYVRTRLQPLFEKYRVDLVLSGHQHNYQRGMHKGINYIISGGAGGNLDRKRVEDYHVFKKTVLEHHYVMMSVTRSGMALQVFSVSDRLLDSFYIPRNVARKMKPSEMLPQ